MRHQLLRISRRNRATSIWFSTTTRPTKTPEVQAWLEKHPRFKLHFTPTSASWMNLVERFFAEITTKRIRRGSYSSVDDLEDAIYDYLLQHNAKPKPFVWSKTAEDILTREQPRTRRARPYQRKSVANVGLRTLVGWRKRRRRLGMDIEITTVFRKVLDAYPVEDGNEVERDARCGHILAVICSELRAAGKTATLVSQKYSPALVLPQNTLEEGATPYVLGTVGAVYYQPDGITYSDPNGRVHIPVSVGEVAAARAIREVETGQWRSNWDKVATPVERHVPENQGGASGYLSHPV